MDGPARLLRFLITSAVLVGVWAILSGKFDAMHFGIGVVGSVLIAATFFPWRTQRRAFPLLPFILYVPWELYQIVKSNLHVAMLVLRPSMPIAPRFIRRRPGVADERALTLLGCSITLTPGTLTVDIESNQMLVHALDGGSAAGIEADEIATQVARVFKEPRP